MKKGIFAAGFVLLLTAAAHAQKKKEPPPPPMPPAAPVERMADVPPPPPPPPAPPVPPKKGMKANYPQAYEDFLRRNPSVSAVYWKENAVVIEQKVGKTEQYTLNENGIRQAEAKYGKLPPPPPAPPKPPVAPPPLADF